MSKCRQPSGHWHSAVWVHRVPVSTRRGWVWRALFQAKQCRAWAEGWAGLVSKGRVNLSRLPKEAKWGQKKSHRFVNLPGSSRWRLVFATLGLGKWEGYRWRCMIIKQAYLTPAFSHRTAPGHPSGSEGALCNRVGGFWLQHVMVCNLFDRIIGQSWAQGLGDKEFTEKHVFKQWESEKRGHHSQWKLQLATGHILPVFYNSYLLFQDLNRITWSNDTV